MTGGPDSSFGGCFFGSLLLVLPERHCTTPLPQNLGFLSRTQALTFAPGPNCKGRRKQLQSVSPHCAHFPATSTPHMQGCHVRYVPCAATLILIVGLCHHELQVIRIKVGAGCPYLFDRCTKQSLVAFGVFVLKTRLGGFGESTKVAVGLLGLAGRIRAGITFARFCKHFAKHLELCACAGKCAPLQCVTRHSICTAAMWLQPGSISFGLVVALQDLRFLGA